MKLLSFDNKNFLENIHWHTSKQLSVLNLMYTLTVTVKIQLCTKHLFSPQGDVASCFTE